MDISNYRYQDKTRTKETTIIMLANSCESALRSLTNLTHKRLKMINNLINSRIDDGQLDEAPLTFRTLK